MKQILLALIVFYQRAISPWLGPHCRFYPSCSEWSRRSVRRYGPARGMGLTLRRLLLCQPFYNA